MNKQDEDRLRQLEEENRKLKDYIRLLENKNNTLDNTVQPKESTNVDPSKFYAYQEVDKLLTNQQISRFSRHLLLPEIGVKGQAGICNGSVLVVGAGGLGAPCLLYLAAAGVGRIGIVDFDRVDISNLQRQVIHTEDRRDQPKVTSAAISVKNLNSSIQVDTYDEPFETHNGLDLVSKYDIIVDASDNVSTRYMVNDACIIAKKPLVSASAVRFDGQLTVYNYGPDCPCYRCLFPEAPPAETVTNCADGGVCGVVPGIMGCLQALQVLELLMIKGGGGDGLNVLSRRMVLFQARDTTFRTVQLRKRSPTCAVCGDHPSITQLSHMGAPACAAPRSFEAISSVLNADNRASVMQLKDVMDSQGEPGGKYLLLDVREPVQFDIASIPGAVNVPLKDIKSKPQQVEELINNVGGDPSNFPVYVMCRRGVASVSATKALVTQKSFGNVKNVDGGIDEWIRLVDQRFPSY
ncbi:adenylyltransferase and sulfurtransferase [Acrasis kona]|uniref:Adenylyltransferase and sulfurtransferase MOCS3 homolog n=1 Tax=Acrasis kona TaxID=1008807 RepID=A0AAW2YUT5_9EUKA